MFRNCLYSHCRACCILSYFGDTAAWFVLVELIIIYYFCCFVACAAVSCFPIARVSVAELVVSSIILLCSCCLSLHCQACNYSFIPLFCYLHHYACFPTFSCVISLCTALLSLAAVVLIASSIGYLIICYRQWECICDACGCNFSNTLSRNFISIQEWSLAKGNTCMLHIVEHYIKTVLPALGKFLL